MATTIHDVARMAGVSIKTVSNVLNDYASIRPATKQRVLEAIDVSGLHAQPDGPGAPVRRAPD